MNWLQSILYGLVSGLTEYLPVSSQAHQQLMHLIFGVNEPDPVRTFLIHVATLAALFVAYRPYLDQIKREQANHRRRRNSTLSSQTIDDVRVVKNAVLPLVIGILILSYLYNGKGSLIMLALMLLINGIILFLPERVIRGNKSGGAMSAMDSFLLGIASALSVIPGFSRMGTALSLSQIRGADRQKALSWTFLLSIPAIATLVILDVFHIITGVGAVPFWVNLGGYLLSALASYASAYCGVFLMKTIVTKAGVTGFSFYSWGMSLLTFILYLTAI